MDTLVKFVLMKIGSSIFRAQPLRMARRSSAEIFGANVEEGLMRYEQEDIEYNRF